MLIQVDVDSTLYDADALFDELARENDIEWPRRAKSWLPAYEIKRFDGTPCTVEDLKKVFRIAHSREWVMQNKPYPHSVKVLQGIVNDYPEAEIAYVSDRNEQQTGSLREWLDEKGFLFSDDTHVAATKDKRHWMRERRPEVVIDDRVRTMLMARYELGSYVVSLEHNHNTNLRNEVEHIYIMKDWKGIDEVLRETILPKLQQKAVTREKELSY